MDIFRLLQIDWAMLLLSLPERTVLLWIFYPCSPDILIIQKAAFILLPWKPCIALRFVLLEHGRSLLLSPQNSQIDEQLHLVV